MQERSRQWGLSPTAANSVNAPHADTLPMDHHIPASLPQSLLREGFCFSAWIGLETCMWYLVLVACLMTKASRDSKALGGLADVRLSIHDNAEKRPRSYFEFSNHQDGPWPVHIINNHVHVLRFLFWMIDKPCTWRNPRLQAVAGTRRRLMPGWSIWIPDAALAGRRIVPFRDIQVRVTMRMEIRSAIVIVPAPMRVLFPFS